MQELLEDYKRRLETINELIEKTRSNGSIVHQRREERLNTKAECYRTLITELAKITQPSKNNNKLGIADVKHRFSIDDPIIVKASLDIRSEHVCSNPLRKPEEIDRQLKGYLVELLNSLNGA